MALDTLFFDLKINDLTDKQIESIKKKLSDLGVDTKFKIDVDKNKITSSIKDAIKNNSVDWSVVTASLDRIDSSKGYQPGNVWWVHKRVNRLKNDFSMDELLYWSRAIVRQHGNPEPSRGGDTSEGATTRDRVLRDSNIPKSAQPISNDGDDIV